MIVSDAFKDKRYAVLGLARSGLAAVETLLASGAHVMAWDSREEPRLVAVGGHPHGRRLGCQIPGCRPTLDRLEALLDARNAAGARHALDVEGCLTGGGRGGGGHARPASA